MREERDRLRDLYSEYREGTLDARLRANVEARLHADPALREDYAAFDAACAGLGEFADERIEAPDFLSARIFDRMEAAHEALPAPTGRLGLASLTNGLWGRLGLAALALVAVGGAALTVARRNDASSVAPAGMVPAPVSPVSPASPTAPTNPSTDPKLADGRGAANGNGLPGRSTDVDPNAPRRDPRVAMVPASPDVIHPILVDGRVFVELQGALPHDVSILAVPDAKNPSGVLLRRFRVDGTRLHSELSNPYADPAAFVVRMDREDDALLVVVPGSDRSRAAASGSGDLLTFAKALARTFGTPVALRVNPDVLTVSLAPGATNAPETGVSLDSGASAGMANSGTVNSGATIAPSAPATIVWNFDDPAVRSQEAQAHALHALEGRGYSVDVMPGGLLSITDR